MTPPCQYSTRTSLLLGLGLFIVFLALYLFSHISHFFNRDPLYYSLQVETQPWEGLFSDPHHLLYRPAARLWLGLWQAFGWKEGGMFPLQALSALAGAATVSLFCLLLLTLTRGLRVSLIGAAFLGFSYGLWRYSAEVYPHVFLLLFATAAALFLTQGLEGPGSRRLQPAQPKGCGYHPAPTEKQASDREPVCTFLLAGAFSGLGALFYQTGILFLFPALWLILTGGQMARSRRLLAALVFLATCLLLVALPYLGMAEHSGRQVADIFHYQHSASGWMGYGRLSPTSLLKAPIGAGNLFLGEVFAREHLSARPRVRELLASHSGIPLLPADEKAPSFAYLCPLYLLFGLSLGSLIWLCLLPFFHWRKMGRQFPFGRALALTWFAPYAAFAIWWFPENRQYWLGALPGLCLLLVLVARSAGRLRLLGVCAGLLALVNFLGSIAPDRQPQRNPLLQRTRALTGQVAPGDLVLTISAGELKHLSCYLEYYLRCRTVDLLGLFFHPEGSSKGGSIIRQEISRAWAENRRVFLIDEALGSPLVCQQIAKYKHTLPGEAKSVLEGFLCDYRKEPVVLFRGRPLLWRLEPLSPS